MHIYFLQVDKYLDDMGFSTNLVATTGYATVGSITHAIDLNVMPITKLLVFVMIMLTASFLRVFSTKLKNPRLAFCIKHIMSYIAYISTYIATHCAIIAGTNIMRWNGIANIHGICVLVCIAMLCIVLLSNIHFPIRQ